MLSLPGLSIAEDLAEQRAPQCVLSIPTQALNSALLAFGNQCGIQLVVSSDSIAGRTSPGVFGRQDAAQALQQLLAESPLPFRFLTATTAVVGEVRDFGRAQASSQRPVALHPESTLASASAEAERTKPSHIVVVTGTRLRRAALDAPTAMITLYAADLEASGKTNLADALVELPAVNPGITPQNSQNLTSGGAGLNLLSLRGMGLERTLVLVNGRRQVGSARGTSAVDLNTIPTAFVDRVEIVTGGTSAIYGADSISGAVNVILKDRHDGVHLDYQRGLSSRGDADSAQLSLVAGSDFADVAGHVMVAAVHDRSAGVDALDRGYASDGFNVIASSTVRPRFEHRGDVRFNSYSYQGSFTLAGQRYLFLDDGSGIRAFDLGTSGDRFGQQIGGDGVSFERYDMLRMPVARTGAMLNAEYELFAAGRLFFEGRIMRTRTRAAWQPIIDPAPNEFLPLHSDNPYLPADALELMRRTGTQTLLVARVEDEFGRGGSRNERRLMQFTAGVDGALGGDWSYELFASVGRNRDDIVSTNTRDTARFFESLDAVRDPLTGNIVCRDADARERGCVPLNVVGIDAPSHAAVDYSRVDLAAHEDQQQIVAGGHLAGRALAAQSGRLDVAVGWEYRDEFSRRSSSALQAAGASYLPRAPSGSGRYSVAEGFAELTAHLFENAVPGDSLQLGVAGRASSYTTVGTEWTWQSTLNYSPTGDVHLRAARSRSIRAPNIAELFFAGVEGFVEVADPCDAIARGSTATRAANCAALGLPVDFDARNGVTRRIFFGSNERLGSEDADTLTAGVVLTPQLAPGVRLSADYWRIDLDDTIAPFDAQAVIDRCVDAPTAVASNPFCTLVAREPGSGLIDVIRVKEENAGRLQSEGVDLEVLYGPETPSLQHALRLQLRATYLSRLKFANSLDTRLQNRLLGAGVLPNPRWQAQAYLEYERRQLRLAWRTQYVGSSRIRLPVDIELDRPHTGAELFHDFYASWDLGQRARLDFGVTNVFDNKPPRRGFNIKQGIGAAALYPNLGTQFFAGLSIDL